MAHFNLRQIITIFLIILFVFYTNVSFDKTINVQLQNNVKNSKIKTYNIEFNPKQEQDTLIKFITSYKFENFKADIYTGKVALPDFKNNPFAKDKEYVKFIKDGCNKNGINFAGHYTIIENGCGAECEHIFIIDRINGKIFIDTKPNDGRYGYKFRKDSRLLIANSNVFVDDKLEYYQNDIWKPELYVWKKNNFVRLKIKK